VSAPTSPSPYRRPQVKALEAAAPYEDDDQLLLRFLRARALHPAKALRMLNEDLVWREANNIRRLRHAKPHDILGCDPDLINPSFPHGLLGSDYSGRPVVYKDYGKFTLSVLSAFADCMSLVNYDTWMAERSIARLPRHVQGFVVIIDLKGIPASHITKANLNYCHELSLAGTPHYPERLGQMFIVNSPALFRAPYTLITSWLDARSVSKIQLLGGPEE
jgi:hypothetical protein